MRSLDEIAEKWRRRCLAAIGDYAKGVVAPRRPWREQTLASADKWARRVLEAAAENTYARSVAATPSEYWKSRTSTISINRYTEGVRGTVKVYEVFKTLSELVLPPRAPRGDPRNLERVRAIIKALRAKKTS
ncbi:MAG: hypothetical protein QW579_07800 [Desulfurococcaceae archaeon]